MIAQWPSVEWLTEKFPARTPGESAAGHANVWLAYESSFETILAAWDEVKSYSVKGQQVGCTILVPPVGDILLAPQGVFTVMWPAHPIALAGLIACIE